MIFRRLVFLFLFGVATVHASPDPKHWCAHENQDVILPFLLPQPDEQGFLQTIVIKLQHFKQKPIDVLSIGVYDLAVVVHPEYTSRLNYTVSVLENKVYVIISNVTVDDDGLYKCYSGLEPIEECDVKLNVYNDRQRPIINQSWLIFHGQDFNVTCENSNFDLGQEYPYIRLLRLYRRAIPNIHSFNVFAEVANYNVQKDERKVWIQNYEGDWSYEHDQAKPRITLMVKGAGLKDSGEYGCEAVTSMSEKSHVLMTFYSLVELVNVRAYYHPMDMTECQDPSVKAMAGFGRNGSTQTCYECQLLMIGLMWASVLLPYLKPRFGGAI
ncbi:hypothetical protein BgiMline_016622 [Biomphalaria glabrata]|uniref:Uncharacterized protein LOC106061934 isoform X1 n=1 Tax=Biomphalaria glabrata TaxID=6526 RepID=A0A9W3AM17_BIOGL|nr:uncharacterized protein LOC106061934 isoform X1 [Biomphalaria glabrata]XP_055888281.1 uncharacterized protein LOC106061934 isoform X1 [Biomphalaria glabrata]KAI8792288.1 hypothetical protein BgiBS90_007752 [Biomphalaria glabrata]